MKRERNRKWQKDITLFYRILEFDGAISDTRYWGLFYCKRDKKTRVKIDVKRYMRLFPSDDANVEVMNAYKQRNRSHYFYPAKERYFDYNCNVIVREFKALHSTWNTQYKPMVERELERVEQPQQFVVGSDYNMQCGISSYAAAEARTNFRNYMAQADYKARCRELIISLYAQFFHQMAAQIEAVAVRILTKNRAMGDTFKRDMLYSAAIASEKAVKELPSHAAWDRMYCIWHFVKHNTASTYKKLKERYPEVLHNVEFQQGDLAIRHVKFSTELIEEVMEGCESFFLEFCKLVFKEDYAEAQWNYDGHFLSTVEDAIEDIENPLGLDIFDDID